MRLSPAQMSNPRDASLVGIDISPYTVRVERWSIRVRPTIVAYLVYLPLYVFPPILGSCVLLAIEYPILIVTTGHLSGPLPGWALPLILLAWIAATIPFVVLVHRIVRYFLDRARLRLTPDTLYLGRVEQPVRLDRVRESYFVSQHGLGRRKYRVARRSAFNVLLLVLDDGSLVPISPPPGQFTDLMPEMYAATANVAQFMHASALSWSPHWSTTDRCHPRRWPFYIRWKATGCTTRHSHRRPVSGQRWPDGPGSSEMQWRTRQVRLVGALAVNAER